MQAKIFEVRDSMTCIPVLVVELASAVSNNSERMLLRHAGYAAGDRCFMLVQIAGGGGKCSCDPYDFTGNRTLMTAFEYIQNHWDELEPGQVVDVQFILGETTQPKASDMRPF
jgi:hypothetical protein